MRCSVVLASVVWWSGCTGGLTADAPDAQVPRGDAAMSGRDAGPTLEPGSDGGSPEPDPDVDAGTPITPEPGCGTEAADVPPWGWQWLGMGAVHEVVVGDYDGDCKDDATIVNRGAGVWWHRPSGAGRPSRFWEWAWPGMGGIHEVVPGDFDGDGMDDLTIVDRANGLWWTTPSNGAPPRFWEWPWLGMSSAHEVVPGDFDGDGLADPTIVNRAAALWWTVASDGAPPRFWEWSWAGMGGGHEVVPGDFDGDGIADRTIVDRGAGVWWTVPSSGAASRFWGWGWAGMGAHHEVVVGDYDGDGMDDPAIVDRARGLMWITTSNGSPVSVWGHRIPHFGPDSTPAPGDYDGDGRTDIAFVQRARGRWFVRPSSGACPALRTPIDNVPGAPWRFEGGPGYPDIVDPGDGCSTIVATRDQLVAALAAARPGTTVYVDDNATIDLTDTSITVPAFVTLASGRGRGASRGALLHTTTVNSGGMIIVGGEGVRITGLRIRGHETNICPGGGTACDDVPPPSSEYSRGINSTHDRVEVDNCELWGWTFGAIAIHDAFENHFHHNFIHHNQRAHVGYGIVLESRSFASQVLIEWNRFNFNRHSVAGGGAPGQSYVARYNLVGARANGHVFDMHGVDTGGLNCERGDAGCVAGTNIQVYGNAVMVLDRSMVRVRGRSIEGTWTYGNCFARPRYDASLGNTGADAIAQVNVDSAPYHFWVDYAPDATHSPNRYNRTAAECGVADYLR